jgi:hypothetical protein
LTASPFQKVEDAPATNADVGVAIFEVRRDVMTGSSATHNDDYATKNQDADGFSYGRNKSYDSPSNADRVFEVAPPWSRNVVTPVAIIAAAQTITTAWADLGPEIALAGYTKVALWLNLTIGQANNIRVRALAKHTSAGTEEYSLPITRVEAPDGAPWFLSSQAEFVEFDLDADQKAILTWDIDNVIPFVQFQVMMVTDGGTDPTVATANITYAWS